MTNTKFFAWTVSVLLACSGLFVCGKSTRTAAEENSVASAKISFAEEMAARPLTRSTPDCDDLISQAFFAEGEEKELLLEELSHKGIYRFKTEVYRQEESEDQRNLNASSPESEEITPYGIAIYPNCGTGDVNIYAPEVYYRAGDQTWVRLLRRKMEERKCFTEIQCFCKDNRRT